MTMSTKILAFQSILPVTFRKVPKVSKYLYFQQMNFLFGVVSSVMVCQILGIVLKWGYYCRFHVWKNTFSRKESAQRFKESAVICCSRIIKYQKEDESSTNEKLNQGV